MKSTEIKVAEKSNKAFYDTYYDKPDWWFRFRYDTQVKLKTIFYLCKKAGIPLKNQSVCELGFGNGNVLFKFDTSCRLFGIEIAETALAKARKTAAERNYKEFAFYGLNETGIFPFDDASMNIVIASHVIEHVTDEERLIHEIRRVLRPGGKAIILIPINERYNDPKHVREYTSNSCKSTFEEKGFRTILGIENELSYHLIEDLYWKYQHREWPPVANAIRIFFNLTISQFPYWGYMAADGLLKNMFGLKPRQAAIVFEKEAS